MMQIRPLKSIGRKIAMVVEVLADSKVRAQFATVAGIEHRAPDLAAPPSCVPPAVGRGPSQ